MKTYFVALVPPPPLLQEISRIKDSFAENYGAIHALKLPPHITLIPPFKIKTDDEYALITYLHKSVAKTEKFELLLDGYDAFAPRVIFINVLNPNPVKRIYDRLYETPGNLLPPKPERPLHPHITIATRDLSVPMFKRSFSNFKEKEFVATFPVHSLFLFRHTSRNWEILAEIPFKGDVAITPLS